MFNVQAFDIHDVIPLLNQPMNEPYMAWKVDNYAYVGQLWENSHALTGRVDDQVMVCAFFVEIWPGRAYMASIFSEKTAEHPVQVYRGMKSLIPALGYDRIEFDCPMDLEIAHRRAKFMGFDVMCDRARKYSPDGSDAKLFEWVRQ